MDAPSRELRLPDVVQLKRGAVEPTGFSSGDASAAVAFGFVTFTLWLYTSVLAFIRFRNAPTYANPRLLNVRPTGIQQTDAASVRSHRLCHMAQYTAAC